MSRLPFCSHCGKELDPAATVCPGCGGPGLARAAPGDPGAMKYVLPVGRSGWAIAAGYLGLFSLVVIFAPFALVCGIIALRDIAKHPERSGKPRAIFGIVMGAIGTLLLTFLLLF